ncbi:HYC_CC_PP family protein [Pseudoalteromonas ruthenica]|uniref:DUF2946 domain-containing protein n=1 Tax=Pseudoalteromonas ruthenica TaxID=151081 RepID=A0A0F4PYW2_9GAMM|nr:hypothetical protein [Pseudoalteromonas ruthenica]KJY97159.1 hypothetical protein TW72_15155 [Pseudoalteromonas ruthenica]KJY99471.1 hypothetical protein TW76_03505 [Pseudoalteromonas ruthenica]TMO86833.1 hypothetical protein CWC12_13120 [Pseudoalteromonas ruthenica]TMO93451.1 hypothetical protein CWC13_06465 [Pseudoalteromonas ruthenica]TMO96453.1 hypothetical protein CWC07_17185 [Pseudoalteromonas ruthenica]
MLVRVLISLLMAVLLVLMPFSQTADAHVCHDNGQMQHSTMQEADARDCENGEQEHNSCCADMTIRHCSGSSVLFVGQSSAVNAAAINFSTKVDSPIDTSIRAKHASNLFRPPIIIA